MAEFYIEANSFSAPFFSDQSYAYVNADTAKLALESFADSYSHPAALYAAFAYSSSDAMKKGEKPLAKWLCNHEIERSRIVADRGSYSYLGNAPGDFEIDGVRHRVDNPTSGKVTP